MSVCESQLRIVHNVFGGPNVDIYLEGKPLALQLAYKDITDFLNIVKGNVLLEVKVAGAVLLSKKFTATDRPQTLYIIGDISDLTTITGKLVRESLTCPTAGYARVNVFHGIFGAPNVDIYANGQKIISNLRYGKGDSAPVKIGQVALIGGNPYYVVVEVKISGTSTVIIGPTNYYLISGGIYTLVASGTLTTSIFLLVAHDNKNACEVLQKNFDVQSYMNRWYQIASIPQLYEANCPRATAVYTLLDNRVNVFNTCYAKDWEVVETITGAAYPECNPAALRVTFPNVPTFYPGPNYLIHKTDYKSYAVIGSPTRTTFYILSRTPTMSPKQYDKLLKYGQSLGYDISTVKPNYHAIR